MPDELTPEYFAAWREGKLESIGTTEEEIGNIGISFEVQIVHVKDRPKPPHPRDRDDPLASPLYELPGDTYE